MKRLLYLSLMLPIVFIASAQTPDPFSFYPYHKGDVRQYRSQFTGDLIYTIYTDSVVIIPTIKDIMIYNRFVSGMTTDRIDRIDSLGNLYIMRGYQSEYIHYKLFADSGDIWQTGVVYDTIPVMATVVYTYKANVFGNYTTTIKAIRFQYQYVPPPAQPFMLGTDHLAEGFGLVESEVEPSDVYVLTGAIIDGVRYGTMVSVGEPVKTIPEQITLFQNHPNPFNPETAMSYRLPITSYISLKVYDLLGREVKILYEGYQTPGIHTHRFTASSLSSGVYYYELRVKEYVMRKRMLLLK